MRTPGRRTDVTFGRRVLGGCSGWLTRFVVDMRLPWPSTCPDCGGSVVSEDEVEPVARGLPF